jgi:histidinol-phosphatase (PHP family)
MAEEAKMLLDYHIHSALCGHAKGKPGEYLASAVKAGLREVGFADHAPLPPEAREKIRLSVPFRRITMTDKEVPGYIRAVHRLKKISPIPVKLGMEVDYLPYSRSVFNLLADHDFDYFIGSVHFVDHWGFDQEEFLFEQERYGYGPLIRRYLSLIRGMASTRLFDIVGHLDLPKKFGTKPGRQFDADFRATLSEIRKNGMAVELNTSGWERPVREAYPSRKILRTCFEMDIPVTLGSDSHAPDQVARHFGRAKNLLKSVGYNRIASFLGHRLIPVRM